MAAVSVKRSIKHWFLVFFIIILIINEFLKLA